MSIQATNTFAERLLEVRFNGFVEQLREGLRENIRKQGSRGSYTSNTVATGGLLRSLEAVVKRENALIIGEVYALSYWRQADQGSPPGTRVEPSALLKWAKAKGIPQASMSFAERVAERIRVRGTNQPPSRFFTSRAPGFLDSLTAQLIAELPVPEPQVA